MSDRESRPANVEDLDKPVTDKNAEQVKGGISSAPATPIVVKQVNPRLIVPCV
jgi:hypothetical protein